jgi:CRISPR/Cas system-associated exonuclease Cas4 (RecB family)
MIGSKTSTAQYVRQVAIQSTVLLFTLFALTLIPTSSWAANIYDAQVLERIKLTPHQRVKVSRITGQSDVDIAAVFEKYRIDPKATPEFDKLQRAAGELQVIEAKEKRAMKKVLSKAQYKTYLALIQETATSVMKATRR